MPRKAQTKKKRIWLRIVVGTMAVLIAGVLLAVWGLLRTPGWYAPAAVPVDPAERQAIRNRLVNAEQAFTHELINGRPFKYHIYAADVNEWLAMRYDIYPRIDDVVPPMVRDPFVSIGEDGVRFAGRVEYANRNAVLSAELLPTFENGDIVLRLGALRCGSLPLPNLIEQLELDRAVHFDRSEAWPGSPVISGSVADGLRVGGRGWWRNGGVDYEVTDLTIGEGVLTLHITPLERQAGARRD